MNIAELESPRVADLIGLAEAAAMIRGRGGKPACVASLRKWSKKEWGCRPVGKDGPAVVLKTVVIAGDLLTTRQWIEQFENERLRIGLTYTRAAGPALRSASPRARAASRKRAKRVLEEMGVG